MKTKTLHMEISEERHRRLKLAACTLGLSMRDLVLEAVEMYIADCASAGAALTERKAN
jgi:predicted HicB family RNase H-like nuclease